VINLTRKATRLLLGLFLAVNGPAAPLTVHAASLTAAMKEIAVVYEKGSGDKLRLNFDSSSTLGRQIQEGAPGDLFLSADEAQPGISPHPVLVVESSSGQPILIGHDRRQVTDVVGAVVALRNKHIAQDKVVRASHMARNWPRRTWMPSSSLSVK
jgi:molybdenum ABC transporter molybdate-binding protein